ncbi:hypothetical protein [Jeotgalibacillus soli]|uniref:Uncharacterized protein n=1 Tax=Jeotgalibacillus soli TaxID=889306 RepID=A0A0C2W030_9BACL|nr:hypothetical protein [Jeotgalibacillus soli]KIL49518.1 hypothetical protein KP78_09860 [Jeotgalibacillus soli]
MKTFLIIPQFLYLLCLFPWLAIFVLSFMNFDNGFSWSNIAFVLSIGFYPVAVIFCSIVAWVLRTPMKRTAVITNLVPMIWVAGSVHVNACFFCEIN